MNKVSAFIDELSSLSFRDTFNPYSDYCIENDIESAPQIRKKTLFDILTKASQVEVSSIWIGRDLGYRGGRRTGLALTDDVHIENHAARWGVKPINPTKGICISERTAAMIWSVLDNIDENIFLWNAFPFLPHLSNLPFTNRNHNSIERKCGIEILEQLINIVEPRYLIAIGNDAFNTASRIKTTCEVKKVRHPSYGGHNIFLKQILELYS